jgi:ATP-dependent Zn protease
VIVHILLIVLCAVSYVLIGYMTADFFKQLAPPPPSRKAAAKRGAPAIEAPNLFMVRTAAHEAGHALLALSTTAVARVTGIRVDDDGLAGVMNYRKSHLVYLDESPRALWCLLVIDLGGMVAEMMVCGSVKTNPCRDDLLSARAYAKQIVDVSTLGRFPWSRPRRTKAPDFHRMFEGGLPEVEHEVMSLAYGLAWDLLERRREQLDELAALLAHKKVLSEHEVEQWFGNRNLLLGLGKIIGHRFV